MANTPNNNNPIKIHGYMNPEQIDASFAHTKELMNKSPDKFIEMLKKQEQTICYQNQEIERLIKTLERRSSEWIFLSILSAFALIGIIYIIFNILGKITVNY